LHAVDNGRQVGRDLIAELLHARGEVKPQLGQVRLPPSGFDE
jgi:hypothetical protein